jgi:hypothetical protein
MELLLRIDRFRAHRLVELLAMRGIVAHVFNENLQGAIGEVPPDQALPQVWLADPGDRERAARVARTFFAEGERQGEWTCARCGECNPASFEVCWHCGGAQC